MQQVAATRILRSRTTRCHQREEAAWRIFSTLRILQKERTRMMKHRTTENGKDSSKSHLLLDRTRHQSQLAPVSLTLPDSWPFTATPSSRTRLTVFLRPIFGNRHLLATIFPCQPSEYHRGPKPSPVIYLLMSLFCMRGAVEYLLSQDTLMRRQSAAIHGRATTTSMRS